MVLGITTEYQTGSTGAEVSQIQAMLAFLGYLSTAPDGQYGPKTKEAVQRFQSDKGLAIDGIVGPNTWAALFGGGAAPASQPSVIVLPKPSPIPTSVPVPVSLPGLGLFPAGQPSPVLLVGAGLLAISGLMLFGTPAPAKAKAKRKRRR